MEGLTLAAIIGIANLGYTIIKDIVANNRGTAEEQRDAIDAMTLAAIETKEYLEYLEEGGAQKRSQERELSRLWREAAQKVDRINIDLGGRLYLKANYWLDPEKWCDRDIEKAKIGFATILREARNLNPTA